MNVYRANTSVTVTVPFTVGGVAVVPTSISYSVADETGAILVADTPLALVDGATSVVVTVDAAANALPTSARRSMRAVNLHMTDAGGTCVSTVRYAIQGDQALEVMINSYQTFESALLEAMDMPTLKAWPSKSDSDRIAALIESFHRLGRLKYRIKNSYVEDELSRWEPRHLRHINDLNQRSLTEFINYPAHFRRALRRAQVAEADVVLEGDLIGDRRRGGLMSESIGESSMMFRPWKPVALPVSEQALRHLQGFVTFSINSTRS